MNNYSGGLFESNPQQGAASDGHSSGTQQVWKVRDFVPRSPSQSPVSSLHHEELNPMSRSVAPSQSQGLMSGRVQHTSSANQFTMNTTFHSMQQSMPATPKTEWKVRDFVPTFHPTEHAPRDAAAKPAAAPVVAVAAAAATSSQQTVQPVVAEPRRAAPPQPASVNKAGLKVQRTMSCPPATQTVVPTQPPPPQKKEAPATAAATASRAPAKSEEKIAKKEAPKEPEKSAKASESTAAAEAKKEPVQDKRKKGRGPTATPSKTPTPPPQATSQAASGKKEAAKSPKPVTVTVSLSQKTKESPAPGRAAPKTTGNSKEDMKKSARPQEKKDEKKKVAASKEETPKKKEEAQKSASTDKKPAAPKVVEVKPVMPKAVEPKPVSPKVVEVKPVPAAKPATETKKESANAPAKTPEPAPSTSPSPPLLAPDATMAVAQPTKSSATPVSSEQSDKEASSKTTPSEVDVVTERSATVAAVGVTPPSVTPLVPPSRSVGPLAYVYTVAELLNFRDKSPMLDAETQRKIKDTFTERSGKRKASSKESKFKSAQPRSHSVRASGMARSRAARVLPRSENGFKMTLQRDVSKLSDSVQTKRAIQEILNKLVVENAGVLTQELLKLNYNGDRELYDALAESIFNKAVQESLFVGVYAQLCVDLNRGLDMHGLLDEKGNKLVFKRLLVKRCQKMFEEGAKAEQEDKDDAKEGLSAEELELRNQRRVKSRRQYLGNVVFTTELYKRHVINGKVMVVACIRTLDEKISKQDYSFVEPLYKLLKNVGENLEMVDPAFKAEVNHMYGTLRTAVASKTIGNRDRFMLEEVLDLQKEWARKALQKQHTSPAPKVVATVEEVKPKSQKTETTVRNCINTTLDEFVENDDAAAAFSYFDEDVASSSYLYTLLPTVIAYVLDKPPSLELAERLSTLVVEYANQRSEQKRSEPLFGGLKRAMDKLADILCDLECATDKVIEVFSAFMGNVLVETEFQGTTEFLDCLLKLKSFDPFCTSKEKEYGLPALLFFGTLDSVAQHSKDAEEKKKDMVIMWSSVAKSPALLFDTTELFVGLLRKRGLEFLAPLTVNNAEGELMEGLRKIPQLEPALFHKFLAEKKVLIKDPDAVLLILRYLLETAVIKPKIVTSAKTVCDTLSPWKNDMRSLVSGEQSSLRVQAGILDMLVGFFDRDTDKFCNVLSPFIQFNFIRATEFHMWQECAPLDSVNQTAKKECAAKAKLLLRSK